MTLRAGGREGPEGGKCAVLHAYLLGRPTSPKERPAASSCRRGSQQAMPVPCRCPPPITGARPHLLPVQAPPTTPLLTRVG